MRLTFALLATWFTSLALGAAWSGMDATFDAASYKEDAAIVG